MAMKKIQIKMNKVAVQRWWRYSYTLLKFQISFANYNKTEIRLTPRCACCPQPSRDEMR